MAVIGPMRKLTIGNKTYQIVTGADSLPIASASTLGAIKVGTGLTIDSSTGVLNATGTSLVIDNELSGTSTNPVQNKVIKTALDNKADSNDIPTKVSDLTNDSGFTSNTGTVTSVRVQATSPVQSSTSTAQNSSLNTTISLADSYGDTKNPYGTKTANYVLAGPSSGNAAAPSFRELVASDIPDLSETYLTSFTETDPVFSASVAHGITSSDISNWNGKTSLTIGTSSTTAAAGNHTHGNITNGGDITTTATIANGDRLIINDESASKVTNSSITFGTNDSKYLSNAGTWGDIPTTLPASDVSDWAKADTKPSYTASQVGALATSTRGAANGVVPLNASSKIDSTYLPSYVDDVLEYNGTTNFPSTGEAGKIYVDTSTNKTYRWGGSSYTEISQGSIVSVSRSLTSGTKSATITVNGTGYDIYSTNNDDTKNTAGSTDSSSKLFLIGATSQAANPQTYSHDTAYVGTNGHLYSGSKEVLVGGSNAASSVTITPTTTDVYSMTSAGSVTAGTAPSFTRGTFSAGTLPSLTFAMDTTDTKQLNITFSQGTLPSHAADSFSAGTTPSVVTLPGRSSVIKAWTGYSAATAAAQTFTGATS